MTAPARCPSCGSADVRVVGPIPRSTIFAGRSVPEMPGELAVCRSCHLGFRSPQPSRERLAELYQAGSAAAWSSEELTRRDWELAADFVATVGARTVLDVGCFDGGFLRSLPGDVAKHGVEIHRGAAERAERAGVQIVGHDLHELAGDHAYDVVTAFDVFEHVHDPADLLARLLAVVRPGGHLVLATGDLDAPTWRLMGSRYLYCWYQEHLTFLSPRWLEEQVPRVGARLVRVDRFSHTAGRPLGFALGTTKSLAYRLAPRLTERLRGQAEGDAAFAPPAWTGARDHFVAIVGKTADE